MISLLISGRYEFAGSGSVSFVRASSRLIAHGAAFSFAAAGKTRRRGRRSVSRGRTAAAGKRIWRRGEEEMRGKWERFRRGNGGVKWRPGRALRRGLAAAGKAADYELNRKGGLRLRGFSFPNFTKHVLCESHMA